jgi:hypothetical protein
MFLTELELSNYFEEKEKNMPKKTEAEIERERLE